ncbi:medium-chain acyl-[acyl-carrier-protein] hydrolase [Streptomyces griseochromogenes]|uniref:Medium-chain acyl-[acyl-carrier-protein] hydrolase n=1 Tax=Streptomyces griseochromogenes TaxID=68214 RepID=A0A1B1BAG2_9ACTN|nr:alpha/beta fold hydrolase [Streptomyces griseochromogenes]ANP55813.1 hypothetical protein AVL59_44980 [Streptomyces griseochromogenes]MBP2052536.1 medium-chain acyl-[acyl-carrier-protein] hydrolase [Streptomyces griseochromogenes]
MGQQVRPTGDRLLRRYSHGHRRAVVCFHHAGGGMSAFRGWADALAPNFDLVLVQLKGREDRIVEPLTDDLGDLVLEIAQAICRMPYDDVVLLGHSMGATLAWAVADMLWAIERRPARVVLSAQAPPPYSRKSGGLPAPEDFAECTAGFLDALGEAATGTVGEFYGDTLAADLAWMSREFPSLTPRPLPVDVYCVSGEQDLLLKPDVMGGWAALTTRDFSQVTVAGGHMYLLADPGPLLRLVNMLAVQDSADKAAAVVR